MPANRLTPERLAESIRDRLRAARDSSYGLIGLSTNEAEALLDAAEERDRLQTERIDLQIACDMYEEAPTITPADSDRGVR